jgi:5-methylcytosine-specific restriction protein B
MPARIAVHDGTNAFSVQQAVDSSAQRVAAFNRAKEPEIPILDVPPAPTLIGFDPAVYRQIETALKSGKRHLLFYGPPGTGKTELARYVADQINPKTGYTILTGSADWSSQDLIGGYQPIGGGNIAFVPGVLLRNFDKPLVIDELNRCDIDKVLGPLFSVLSNSSTTLPYRTDVANKDSQQFVILGQYDPDAEPPVYSPHDTWRIIATINTMDKAGLFRMSYALSRRFAWIFVDVPADLNAFIGAFLAIKTGTHIPTPANGFILRNIWQAVNDQRPLGPAPFIDAICYCQTRNPSFEFTSETAVGDAADSYLDAFRVHIMPMLDGLMRTDLEKLAAAVSEAIGLTAGDSRSDALKRHLGALGL